MDLIINEAIKKLTEEMMKNEENIAIRRIEEYLTSICNNQIIAEKILNKEKSIKGALEEIKKVAEKHQVNGCACIDDEEAFKIVDKYFDIENEVIKKEQEEKIVDIMDLIYGE